MGAAVRLVAEEVGLVLAGEGLVRSAAAVGIGGAEVEEEGAVDVLQELPAVIGGDDRVPAAEVAVEVEDRLGGNVVLAGRSGLVAEAGELERERDLVWGWRKMIISDRNLVRLSFHSGISLRLKRTNDS